MGAYLSAARVLRKYESATCCFCERSLTRATDQGLFVPGHTYSTRRGEVTHAYQACTGCFIAEIALKEAAAEGRRFSAVGVAEGERCTCGGVSVAALRNSCIRCHVERRMLKRDLAQARFNARLIAELRRSARDGQDHRAAA